MKKAFTLLLVMAMLVAALLPMSVQAATELKNLTITMELPDPGKAPTTTATCGTGYSIHAIDWLDRETNKFLEPGDKIQGGHKYYAYLWVEAKDGYRFASIDDKTPNVNVTVNGAACTATKAFEYIAPAMVYVAYPITIPSSWIRSVDLTIPEPVYGNKPTYPIIETGAYKYTTMIDLPDVINGIHWTDMTTEQYMDPDNTFHYGVPYQFAISLQPKTGYAFAPYAEARVNGKAASCSLEYGTVLIVEFTFPALEDNHAHVYMDWSWNSGQHYKNCTGCDEIFFAEAHKGGVATCEKDGVCSVCGYAYIKASEEYHVPDTSKWVARGDMYHYHPCKLCGAHCDTEDHRWSPTYLYQDATGHAWICADCKATSAIEKHNPGPAATNTTPQTCKDCGYIIVPAKNHTHELTKVPQTPATCLEEGNIEYYACSGCNNRFTDAEAKNQIPDTMSVAVGALGHTPSDVWGVDDDYHWRVCTTCNQVLDETKMQHDVTDGKCTTCNYVIGDRVTNPETTPAETTPEPGHNAEQSNNTWIKILLVALVCFAAAITATVIILKKKKGE